MRISDLHDAIKAVCPIDGVSSDGRIDFQPTATQQQRAAARAIVDGWDWNAPTPDDADKSPLDVFLSKADAGTLTQKDINEAVVRMARRLRKGM